MKFLIGLGRWLVSVAFAAMFFSLGLTAVSEVYGFELNPRNVWLAILASGTLIWWALPRVRLWWRWRSQREFPIKPFLSALTIAIISGATDACAETAHKWVLTPPDKWPMVQWNPNAVSGLGAWGCAGVFIACFAIAYTILWYFFRGCFQKPQKREVIS